MKYFLTAIVVALTLIITVPLAHAETGDAAARGYTTTAAPLDTGSIAPGNISYTPLEPIPGFIQTGTPNFGAFLGSLFKILLSLGALLAVGRMVVGGIMYMTSEVMETKGDAKRWMTSSLYGLLLLAGSWLILYTINPNLLNFNLNVTSTGNSSVNNGNFITHTSTSSLNDTQISTEAGSGNITTIRINDNSPTRAQEINSFDSRCPGTVKILSTVAGSYTLYACVKTNSDTYEF